MKNKRELHFKKHRKIFMFLLLSFIARTVTYAQGYNSNLTDGSNALKQAATEIGKYFSSVKSVVLAIAAILGLIGAIKVYNKFSSGDPDVGKTAASWFGACIFILVAVYVLGLFFNVPTT